MVRKSDDKESRRGHGSGSVYRRSSDGRWVGRIELGWVDGRRRRRSVVRATQDEAIEALNIMLADHQRGLLSAEKPQPVSDWLTYWIEEIARPRLRPRTYEDYKQVIELHLIPNIGKHLLPKLTARHVQQLINAKRTAGLAPRTIAKIRAVLRAALNDAMSWDLVMRNVASHVTVPAVRPYEGNVLDPDEARRFVDATRTHRLHALFVTALALGLREGELFGLRWQDVDLKKSRLRVVQQYYSSGSTRGTFGPPKTDRSTRPLPIPQPVMDALLAHRERQETERIAAGARWRDLDLVFASTIGTPLEPSNVIKQYRELLEAAGLDRRTFHDLRRSCSSLLAAWSVPPHVVRDILGHSNVTTTLAVYTRTFTNDIRAATDLMGTLWSDDDARDG